MENFKILLHIFVKLTSLSEKAPYDLILSPCDQHCWRRARRGWRRGPGETCSAHTCIVYNLRFSHKLFPSVKTNCKFPGPSKVSGGYVSSVRASGQVVRKNLVLLLICNHESVENLTSNLIFTAYLLPHRDIKLWSDVFFIVIPVLSLINLV